MNSRGVWSGKYSKSTGSCISISMEEFDGGKQVLFTFRDDKDLEWMLSNSPWSFEDQLVLRR